MTVTCAPRKFIPGLTFNKSYAPTSTIPHDQIQHHLVLDLDHTLISSFEFGESPTQRPPGVSTVSPILSEDYVDECGLPQMYHATISNVVVLIKLRPFVRSFIKAAAASGLTLHVYTKGRRAYMHEVIRLIDPEGVIKGRLISRDDEPAHFKDSHKDPSLIDRSFEAGHAGLVVLDDSPTVWSTCAHYAEVIAARRYSFSDRFVTFLRTMEKTGGGVKAGSYPRDGDDYLCGIMDTLVTQAIDRIVKRRAPRTASPLVSSRSMSDEEETLTPINVWSLQEEAMGGEFEEEVKETAAAVTATISAEARRSGGGRVTITLSREAIVSSHN